MHIIGTAGHVDHGKSSLVAALTGTNPDRWLEEQVRGMTLDLGFAHLKLSDGVEAGIVDVPGHERFLHNMLAGAAGMELLLLVIDANEGVRAQTVEHLEILKFLNVRQTVVVLTKIDLVSDEVLEAVRRDVAAALQETIAQNAPIVGISTVTGAGLDALRERIGLMLRALSPRNVDAPVYLPIDRVFVLPGLGTIVTGTLMQGRIAAGDTVRFEPSGKSARVRGLHVFGAAVRTVEAGSRVALNVPAIDRHEIARGETVVGRELVARQHFTVRFVPLPDALRLFRRRNPVHAYFGSAEILGTLVLDEVPDRVEEVRAELQLRDPVVAFAGVRFVVRRPSPRTLLGGGYVEGIEASRVEEIASPAEQAVLAALAERGLEPAEIGEIALAANVREDLTQATVEALVERGDALRVLRPQGYVHASAGRELLGKVLEQLRALHDAEPWAMGLTSVTLARATGVPEPILVRVMTAFVEEGKVVNRAGYYAAVDFTPVLSPMQRELFDQMIPVAESTPFVPVPFADAASSVRSSRIAGAAKAFDTLLAGGGLVKVGDALYRGSQIAKIRARVEDFLRRNERMTAAEFRDLLGTSRKYAVPLLEWLDARGITLRNGDYRTLRKRATVDGR